MASAFNRVLYFFKRLPGVGPKSAERLAFHIFQMKQDDFNAFQRSMSEFREKSRFCSVCGLLSEQDPCKICSSTKRDKSVICIVKNVRDALVIERSKSHNGLYHVLGGLISPVKDTYEKDLNIDALLKRMQHGIKEVIFAFEHTVEADATIQTIVNYLRQYNLKITRVAIGIPIGTGLEFVDDDTVQRSLKNRIVI